MENGMNGGDVVLSPDPKELTPMAALCVGDVAVAPVVTVGDATAETLGSSKGSDGGYDSKGPGSNLTGGAV